jgi:hypothetical protein
VGLIGSHAMGLIGCFGWGRDISNTRMIIEGVRKGRTSVEEEVQRIIHPELRCDTSKFISAGVRVDATWEDREGAEVERVSKRGRDKEDRQGAEVQRVFKRGHDKEKI